MTRPKTALLVVAAVLVIIIGITVAGAIDNDGERSAGDAQVVTHVSDGRHSAGRDSVATQRELAEKWSGPGAEEVSADPSDSSSRMQVADELMSLDSVLSKAPASTVRSILGQPRRTSADRWEYIASRREPSDGHGGSCIRRFTITFDRHHRVRSMDRGGEECPRGLNE